MRVLFRPLLVSGMLAYTDSRGEAIIIDSEQEPAEQIIALWHETLHLLGLKNEDQVEAMAQRLANACPEILAAVKEAHG
jgi:hypothetical protein